MTVRAPIFLENDVTNQTANILRMFVRDLYSDRGGVVNAGDLLVVQRAAGANMSVDVGPGASVNLGTEGSSPGSYIVQNDATINVVITASNPTNPRNDLIISRVRDAFYSGASNDAQIIAVAGTPAGSPVDPDLDALGYENYQRLARVVVPAGATTIVNANIADLRTKATVPSGTFSQATDPGSVGADAFWWNTTTRALLVRNAGNTAWEMLAGTGAWQPYTPSVFNITLGNGVRFGRYIRLGRIIVGNIFFYVGTTTVFSSVIGFGLPFNALDLDSFVGYPGVTTNEFFSHGASRGSLASGVYAAVGVIGQAGPSKNLDRVNFFATAGSAAWGAGVPAAWGSGDRLSIFFEYEAANAQDTNYD